MYDVSSYLNDHPGGAEVMMEVAGQDATNMFEDIGHSTDARTEMKKFEIGLLKVRRSVRPWFGGVRVLFCCVCVCVCTSVSHRSHKMGSTRNSRRFFLGGE